MKYSCWSSVKRTLHSDLLPLMMPASLVFDLFQCLTEADASKQNSQRHVLAKELGKKIGKAHSILAGNMFQVFRCGVFQKQHLSLLQLQHTAKPSTAHFSVVKLHPTSFIGSLEKWNTEKCVKGSTTITTTKSACVYWQLYLIFLLSLFSVLPKGY